MKKFTYLLPESNYMESLLRQIEKDTKKIAKIKKKMGNGLNIRFFPYAMDKISSLNVQRFANMVVYQEICRSLLEGGTEITYYFYEEQFDPSYLYSVFKEETFLAYLGKQLGLPHMGIDDPENDCNLSNYILESVHMGFDLGFIRQCMDMFIANDKELSLYKKAVLRLYNEKLSKEVLLSGKDDSQGLNERFEDTKMNISYLFSIECLSNNKTYNQFMDEKNLEYKKELAENQKKSGAKGDKKPIIKLFDEADWDAQRSNPLFNNPQKER